MRNRRPTSWLLGFAGSAVVHVCAVAALFLFGRADLGVGQPAAAASADAITIATVDPAFASSDPLAGAIAVDITPPRARGTRTRAIATISCR
jgi:hypothetical protein